MINAAFEKNWKIDVIEWAGLPGERPRSAGCNARLGVHGQSVTARTARVTIGGSSGFGWSRIGRERAEDLIGTPVDRLFAEDGSVRDDYRDLEYPLLDWLGRVTGKPVYRLFAGRDAAIAGTDTGPLLVPSYDTTLYFDDLHLKDQQAAVEWMQKEASEGVQRGHRNFKIKVGRGARWMEPEDGIARDIAIIRGIREIAGSEGQIMIDANNGYNLNLTKRVLAATAEARLYWIEEAFHEDRVLYEDLRQWLNREKLSVLIADGEGQASPTLMEWAEQGIVDVVQYDILSPGFSKWLELGRKLDAWGRKSAPHSYGGVYGNFVTGHLAAAIGGFQFVEWDPAVVQGLDDTGFRIREGFVQLPEAPGFGLQLDDAFFTRIRKESGWIVS